MTDAPTLRLSLERDDLEGWHQSVDEHGSLTLTMAAPHAHTRPTFRAAVFDGEGDIETTAVRVVAELETVLSDCLLVESERLIEGPFGGDVAQITFAFRADQVGRFAYYCSLASNEQCRTMKGMLVVAER